MYWVPQCCDILRAESVKRQLQNCWLSQAQWMRPSSITSSGSFFCDGAVQKSLEYLQAAFPNVVLHGKDPAHAMRSATGDTVKVIPSYPPGRLTYAVNSRHEAALDLVYSLNPNTRFFNASSTHYISSLKALNPNPESTKSSKPLALNPSVKS